MISTADNWLIERAQKTADLLGISPLKIAAQLCLGYITFSILYELVRWEGSVASRHFITGIIVVVLASHYRELLKADDKPAGPAMNPLRLRYWLWRRVTIFFLPLMAASMAFVWFRFPPLHAAIDCSMGAMMVCLPFFGSCTKRPPKQKRATIMHRDTVPQGAA